MKKYLFPLGALFVLLACVGIQVYAATRPAPVAPERASLATVLPRNIAGWTVKEMDLGPTESVTERSHDLLRLDDFVHLQYSGRGPTFSVYVAYWKPGKMPVRLVNQHSPDRCWTEVGWVCEDRRWNVEKEVNGRSLQPAQWGEYRIQDYVNNTYFWHIVGGKAHWYGGERMNTRTSITTVFEDIFKFGFDKNREQYFIRIVSDEPLDNIWEEPAFQQVMSSLADLCLEQPETL